MKLNLWNLLLFFLFIFFCLGICVGYYFPNFFVFLFFSFLFLILSYIFYKRYKLFISDICILLFLLSLGALWQSSASFQSTDKFLSKETNIILKAVSLPEEQRYRNAFTGQVKEINSQRVKLKARVMDYTKTIDYLGMYLCKAKLSRRKYHNRWFYYIWIKKDTTPVRLQPNAWDRALKKSSEYILSVFKKNCTQETYVFLSAVFLGRRELLGDEKKSFSKAGASHLLAISGLHLGLTSLILFFFLGFFNIKFRIRLVLSFVFLYFYTFLAGATPSTLRALIMYSAFVCSFLLKRKISLLNSLSLAGFIILIIEPLMLFNIGFQLSFGAVFAIIVGFRIFKVKIVNNLLLNYIKQVIFCSFFVTLFTTPMVSYYFGKINVLSILYNVILIPFFTFILMVNFILIMFSPLGFVAQSLGEILSLFVYLFIKLVRFLSSVPLSYFSYRFSLKGVFVYYLCLIIGYGIKHKIYLYKFKENSLH